MMSLQKLKIKSKVTTIWLSVDITWK